MRLFLLPLLLSLLCACSSGAQPEGVAGAGTLIRLADADSRGLDPQIVSDLVSIRIAADMFEGLTRFDADGRAEAGLAESWTIGADGKSWTFRLHNGLKFSDGTTLSAQVFPAAFAPARGGCR